jgi:hypothetical protein
MSLAEVLTAARALPREEQLELVRSLETTEPTPDPSGIPEHLRHLIPPPGTVIDIWLPTTDEAGWKAIQEELERVKTEGVPK